MADFGTWIGLGAAPSLASVVVNGDTVRATFSEAMLNDTTFQTPGSYVFTTLVGGSVSVSAVNVFPGPGTNPTYVDITLDKPLTIGVLNYRLTVSASLKDKASNLVAAGGRTQDFNGGAVRATITAQGFTANLDKVRVTYTKPVKQVNPANPDDALKPANYAITGGVGVVSVVGVNPQVVELNVTGQEHGHTYTVTVTNVQDTSNNEVAVG